MRASHFLSSSWFRSARVVAITICLAAMAGSNIGCDVRMSPDEIQRRNRDAFAEDIKAEDHRNRLGEGDQFKLADEPPGENAFDEDADPGRGKFLEDDRRREARKRLEQRNKLERGERSTRSSGDKYAKTRRPIKSRESLNRENDAYKQQGPKGKTYLEDTRRSEQRARQEARNRYYRENPQ